MGILDGMMGGILGDAVAGGANQAIDSANKQIDLTNKQAMAQYENQLALERDSAAARLKQGIGREDTMWQLSPGVQTANNSAEAGRASALLQAKASPENIAAQNAIERNALNKLNPGEQVLDGNGDVVAANKNNTMADAYFAGVRGNNSAVSSTEKAREFNERQKASSLEQLWKSPLLSSFSTMGPDMKPAPSLVATNLAMQFHNDAIDAGAPPSKAQQIALQSLAQLKNDITKYKADPKIGPAFGKLDMDQQLQAAMDYRVKMAQAQAAAQGAPTPAPAPAPAVPTGIIAPSMPAAPAQQPPPAPAPYAAPFGSTF